MSRTGAEVIRRQEMSLTKPRIRDMMRKIQTYVFKLSWQSTAKLIRIQARDEDQALEKAVKSKESKNCCSIKLVRIIP